MTKEIEENEIPWCLDFIRTTGKCMWLGGFCKDYNVDNNNECVVKRELRK